METTVATLALMVEPSVAELRKSHALLVLMFPDASYEQLVGPVRADTRRRWEAACVGWDADPPVGIVRPRLADVAMEAAIRSCSMGQGMLVLVFLSIAFECRTGRATL